METVHDVETLDAAVKAGAAAVFAAFSEVLNSFDKMVYYGLADTDQIIDMYGIPLLQFVLDCDARAKIDPTIDPNDAEAWKSIGGPALQTASTGKAQRPRYNLPRLLDPTVLYNCAKNWEASQQTQSDS